MSERFIIRGLGGTRALSGVVPVYGAKNAALKAFAAAPLFKTPFSVHNIPDIEDIDRMRDILHGLSVNTRKTGQASYEITPNKTISTRLPRTVSKRLRTSVVCTGPVLARTGSVSFPHPGGCVIGPRPIDIFLDGYAKMGAKLYRRGEWYELRAPEGGLLGAEIFFRKPSVTATEALMMTAVLARGKTTLKHAAMEPEIAVLANFLNKSGALIRGAGTPTITIYGRKTPLSARGRGFYTPPDRIEAGSFLILGALAGRDLTVSGCEPAHLEALVHILCDAGVRLHIEKDSIRVFGKRGALRALDITTREYPGFPTDLQAPFTVFLTQSSGDALVFETIFEGRFRHIDELVRMGARISTCDPHRVIVRGPTPLSGRHLESPDLRAGLAYILAAVIAKGESVIHNVYTIDRGYERIEERLRDIGVNIKRI